MAKILCQMSGLAIGDEFRLQSVVVLILVNCCPIACNLKLVAGQCPQGAKESINMLGSNFGSSRPITLYAMSSWSLFGFQILHNDTKMSLKRKWLLHEKYVTCDVGQNPGEPLGFDENTSTIFGSGDVTFKSNENSTPSTNCWNPLEIRDVCLGVEFVGMSAIYDIESLRFVCCGGWKTLTYPNL